MKKELEQRFFNKVADRLSFSFDFSEISVEFILFKILKTKRFPRKNSLWGTFSLNIQPMPKNSCSTKFGKLAGIVCGEVKFQNWHNFSRPAAVNFKENRFFSNSGSGNFLKSAIISFCLLQQVNLFNSCLAFCSYISSLLLLFLTHFQPMFHFYTPWKHQKTFVFRCFEGV